MPDCPARRSRAGSRPARSRAARRARLGLIAALAGSPLGCSSLSDIDRRVEELIARDAERLDGGTITPGSRRGEEDATPRSIVTEKKPTTVNPPAENLPFRPGSALTVQDRLKRLDAYTVTPEDSRVLGLEDAFLTAQRSAPEYLSAEEAYILSAIQVLIQRHLWGPRFFNDTTVAYNSNPLDPNGGNYQNALGVINQLRATQRLPYGGAVEAKGVFNATQQLRSVATEDYVQSSQIVLSGNLPLLRGAGLIAQEDLIQAERNLVYASRTFEDFRRSFLVGISRDYFDLVRSQRAVESQANRLKSLRRQQEETVAKVDAGRQSAFDARNVQQSVLNGEIALINERERFLVALDRFKIRLGIPTTEPLRLAAATLVLPEPEITPNAAAEIASRLRLDLQNRRDQALDSRRQVDNARNQTLPDLNLTGSVGFNTNNTNTAPGVDFRRDQNTYSGSATLSLPLDRQIETANLRSALISWQRAERDLRVFEDGILVDARAAVREIDRARFQLDLAEQAVQINLLRQEELELKSDTTTTQQRIDAQNDLLSARLARDAADRDLRISILNYLQVTGQMRVGPDGRFRPLQGMLVEDDPASRTPMAPPDVPPPVTDPAQAPAPAAPEIPPATLQKREEGADQPPSVPADPSAPPAPTDPRETPPRRPPP